MTDPRPGTGHLELDTLAELDEDLLAAGEAEAARHHLAGCAECRDRHASLQGTQSLLAAVPAEPMPTPVAERIAAALAGVSSGQVLPLDTGRRRRWSSTTMAGAAAAVAVIGLASAVFAGAFSSPHRSASNSSTGLRAGAAATPPRQIITRTGTAYSANHAAFTTQVQQLLTPQAAAAAGGTDSAATPAPSAGGAAGAGRKAAVAQTAVLDALIASPTRVAHCAALLNDGVAVLPLAVDYGSYQGRAALIFVLPDPGDPAFANVWVVRTACTVQSSDLRFEHVRRT